MVTASDSAASSSLSWGRLCVVAMIAIGAARIVSTYDVFGETYDEGPHIAAGMQLLDGGTYTYDRQHPPLGRVAAATGPWLAGSRSQGLPTMWQEGRALLHSNNVSRTLFLARLGMLPFFILAVVIIWVWTSRIAGDAAGLVAVALFTTNPTVLAHAGLATTDMPLVATLAAVLYAGSRWLEEPTKARSALFGLAGAAAIASKYSSLVFFGLTALLVWGVRWWYLRNPGEFAASGGGKADRVNPPWIERWLTLSPAHGKGLLLALVTCFVAVWAAYGFQTETLSGIPVPLTALYLGVRELAHHNVLGHAFFLLGSVGAFGDWRFFPVALAVKTPITVLVTGGVGAVLLARRAMRERDWRLWMPILAAVAVLMVSIPARINVGVRHVLPVYVTLAIGGGIAAVAFWRRFRSPVARGAFVAAAIAGLWSTARVHPDYLAYFNELAGQRPERILVDSDLDWGQDLPRLRSALGMRGIDSVTIAYFGSAAPELYGIPVRRRWKRGDDVHGWFVVSQTLRQRGEAQLIMRSRDDFEWDLRPAAFDWLDPYEPAFTVGKSLLVYYLD